MAVVMVGLCGVLVGCAGNAEPVAPEAVEPKAAEGKAGWTALPKSPLSPREAVLGLWTGREVLLIGGSDASPCPPSASCVGDPTPLADGAAFDPATDRWRKIADSPVPLTGGESAVVGGTVYVLPPDGKELLAYRIDADAWARMPVPFGGGYGLLAAGDRLVAYLGSEENGGGKDYLFDPRAATWSALPADPLNPAFDRAMAWTGSELVLFDHELVPNPGSEKPALTRAATLDLAAGSWRRLPDSEILGTGPWLAAGKELVNPMLGGADGGEVNGWGRTYPYGGGVAPATGTWSDLPKPPSGDVYSAGARTGGTAVYFGSDGVVLDTTTGTWQRVPAIPGGDVTHRTVVAAGVRMLVFGGASFDGTPAVVDDAWIWAP
ncbi:hypothetical protein KZ829_14940 [Actinoplanes hulinensis]|uniref:Galactose oxidase n=1 Tax=Actinoplanes hulinensis TaxID=1144547 RepID=A0ABS7B302_9ACTN|nr:hypothetical protein [Actinoplanes hulinensis]MBW6435036.1 hypothetical protein [Actinoplanes hulinensis]